jgi:hypothetical protein
VRHLTSWGKGLSRLYQLVHSGNDAGGKDARARDLYRITKKSTRFLTQKNEAVQRLKALIGQHTVSLIPFQRFEKDRFFEKRKYAYVSQIGAVELFGICLGFLLGNAAG